MLLTTDSTEISKATSGPDGLFQLSAPDYGPYVVQIQHLGYVRLTRSVTVEEGRSEIPAFVLQVSAIPMDTLAVEVERSDIARQGVVGFSRLSCFLTGERMAVLEKTGISFGSAVREIGGVRVRDYGRG